jgi:hypothetical protein
MKSVKPPGGWGTELAQLGLECLSSRAVSAAPKKEAAGVGYHGTAEQVFSDICRRGIREARGTLLLDPDVAVWFTQHPEVQAGVSVFHQRRLVHSKNDYLRLLR